MEDTLPQVQWMLGWHCCLPSNGVNLVLGRVKRSQEERIGSDLMFIAAEAS